MDYDSVLSEFDFLIEKLDGIIEIMIESTKEFIDVGNVNYELKNIINKLDVVIESLEDSNVEKHARNCQRPYNLR